MQNGNIEIKVFLFSQYCLCRKSQIIYENFTILTSEFNKVATHEVNMQNL